MHPAGPQAARIAELAWPLFWTAALVVVLVALAVMTSTWRARQRRDPLDNRHAERTMRRGVIGATLATSALLFVFLVLSIRAERALGSPAAPPGALLIDITGRQWWWQVDYVDKTPSRRVTTANEIHVPVGRPVVLMLRSRDVIHSFWVPNLHGKRDLIPGHATSTWFQADTPGVYRGMCAEFCGAQHAMMALEVVAEPTDRFNAWYAGQLAPAAAPADSLRRHGEALFLGRQCLMCHGVRGTTAAASFGPDLTHLASRRMIAAGTLPNTPTDLARWIADPQRIKPGSHMPATPFTPDDLRALVAYLGGLR
jgi:cytochrome c oxidase subunit 2